MYRKDQTRVLAERIYLNLASLDQRKEARMLGDRMLPTSRFSTRPLYLQLRDALAERIAHGEWRPGTAIPNESDLAREFGVSSGTMRKALDLMEGEHLLTRRQGRGTFVNDQSSDEMAMRFNNVRSKDGQRVCGRVRTWR